MVCKSLCRDNQIRGCTVDFVLSLRLVVQNYKRFVISILERHTVVVFVIRIIYIFIKLDCFLERRSVTLGRYLTFARYTAVIRYAANDCRACAVEVNRAVLVYRSNARVVGLPEVILNVGSRNMKQVGADRLNSYSKLLSCTDFTYNAILRKRNACYRIVGERYPNAVLIFIAECVCYRTCNRAVARLICSR